MSSALQRRIEREDEAKFNAAWEERAAGVTRKRNPRWACDTLANTGQITADQYDAAKRYASAIERSSVGGAAGGERVDGGDSDIHARLWDAAVCRSLVNDGRMFVLRSRTAVRSRMQVFDTLFAYPLPTMAQMRVAPGGERYAAEFAVRRIAAVLDLLAIFFADRDRGYGR